MVVFMDSTCMMVPQVVQVLLICMVIDSWTSVYINSRPKIWLTKHLWLPNSVSVYSDCHNALNTNVSSDPSSHYCRLTEVFCMVYSVGRRARIAELAVKVNSQFSRPFLVEYFVIVLSTQQIFNVADWWFGKDCQICDTTFDQCMCIEQCIQSIAMVMAI